MQICACFSPWCRGIECPPLCLKQDQMLGRMCCISSPARVFPLGLLDVPELCNIRSLLVHGAFNSGPQPITTTQLDEITLILMDKLLNRFIFRLRHATGWCKEGKANRFNRSKRASYTSNEIELGCCVVVLCGFCYLKRCVFLRKRACEDTCCAGEEC